MFIIVSFKLSGIKVTELGSWLKLAGLDHGKRYVPKVVFLILSFRDHSRNVSEVKWMIYFSGSWLVSSDHG